MPVCYLTILVQELSALRAAEQLDAIQATTAPHLERQAYRQMVRQLQTTVLPAPKPKPITFIEHDPEKAAEWFEAHGFRVVRAKKAESA